MTDALLRYLRDCSVQETDVMRRLRERTAEMPDARMQISPEQGQFMRLLVELLGARQALEIGVFTGYSALWVAGALPAEGRLVACDVNREWTDIARQHWDEAGLAPRIELRLGAAATTLDALLAAGAADAFDFAFIDADKARYDAYYERCLRLVRSGGLIAIDNALWSGRVADPSAQDEDTAAIRALTLKTRDDPRVSASLVPIGDGLLLCRRR